jgi:penicillin-binding protein 1C
MRYRLALANSLNISAVKVLAAAGGPEPLQQLLRACGLTTLTRPAEEYGLGLTIGNAEARLLELANAYACLARLGDYKPYRLLLDDVGPAVAWAAGPSTPGETPRPRPPTHRVADAGAAYLIADILSDNDARALAFGAESPLRFTFPVACKTGTSSDFRDNWAFGYTPEFTVGVWAGNADGRPMAQVSGVTGAAPILHDIFERLHQLFGTTWYCSPPDIVECAIDPITGHRLPAPEQNPSPPRPSPLATSHSASVREKFLVGALPPLACAADYDAAGRVRLGREYRDWLASGDNWLAGRAVLADAAESAPRITFPPPGTVLYLDPDLPGQGWRLALRADGAEHLRWESDSLQIVEEQGRVIALLTEGRHQIRADDPHTGAQARTWIEVLAR